jgi:hypothetical protein
MSVFKLGDKMKAQQISKQGHNIAKNCLGPNHFFTKKFNRKLQKI